MITNKLEKDFTLYKNQFDKLSLDTFNDHYLDRASLDLEALSFRIKYMYRNNIDLDKIDEYKQQYCLQSYEVRKATSKVIYNLLINNLHCTDIIDVLIKDIKFDSVYVNLSLIIISDNLNQLQELEELPTLVNIYPNEYFRVYTDAYNDAIANAYPELFENKHVNVGTGNDGDVFVHNVTFQTTEDCSLTCFAEDTVIILDDYDCKNIQDIKIGDHVKGFDKTHLIPKEMHNRRGLALSNAFSRTAKCWKLMRKGHTTWVTPDHKIATNHGWKQLKDINPYVDRIGIADIDDVKLYRYTRKYDIIPSNEVKTVYNFETGSHTYIADGYMAHNCLVAGSPVLMSDFTYKNIEDIQVGDEVLGFEEVPESTHIGPRVMPAIVTHTFCNESSDIYKLSHPLIPDLYVTGDHPFLTSAGTYIKAKDITPKTKIYYLPDNPDIKRKGLVNFTNSRPLKCIKGISVQKTKLQENVYNLETTSHTFISGNLSQHNCRYCYETAKKSIVLDFKIAKNFIDKLLNDEYGYVNRYNSPAIILEFIGGEPLLEIKLTRKIYEYFLDRCYELNHPWFNLHRVSICSNGLQYFEKDVQDFFRDYSSNISFNISIDGNKKLHDTCRVQPNGEGSYDIAISALNHYINNYNSERNSKMTLAPSNIKYLYESVVDFINKGMRSINLNCVFEEGWDENTALTEYKELCKLADYIIDNELENIFISIFNERAEDTSPKENDNNFCGGLGSMLSIRPNGDFYPCIRFMPSSIGDDNETYKFGNVEDGFNDRESGNELLKEMDMTTRRSQSNDICFNCPIGNSCASCSAVGIEYYDTPFKKTTFSCIQNIAEALANVYYWNKLNITHPEYKLGVRKNNVPDEWALIIIDEDELQKLKLIEIQSMVSTIDNN